MNISEFDFALPEELIAHYPAEPRDSSRLLVIGDKLREMVFRDLPSLLKDGDLVVFNNSRVIPARLFGKKGEAKIELLLLRKLENGNWKAFAKPGKKLKVGDIVLFEQGLSCVVAHKYESGEVEVKFNDDAIIKQIGHMPLPPYIKRDDVAADQKSYQTVYAKPEGSVAAPTAGLHFTDELLAKIPNKAFVTLHVGAGTFQPVKTDNIDEHKMHSEWYEISAEVEEKIRAAKRVIAVGTTSLRVLESSGGVAGSGETDIFIKPGYKFKVVDGLVTNFHLPKSTLFILTCAMAGAAKMHKAYKYAIDNKFRFFSYGDACFIST